MNIYTRCLYSKYFPSTTPHFPHLSLPLTGFVIHVDILTCKRIIFLCLFGYSAHFPTKFGSSWSSAVHNDQFSFLQAVEAHDIPHLFDAIENTPLFSCWTLLNIFFILDSRSKCISPVMIRLGKLFLLQPWSRIFEVFFLFLICLLVSWRGTHVPNLCSFPITY